MRSFAVVKIQITANPGARLGNTGIGAQVDLLVFDRPPQTLDKYIVPVLCSTLHGC